VIKPQKERTREEGKKKEQQKQSQTNRKMSIRTYISKITLNVNGLNTPTKRHSLAEWIKKQDHAISYLTDLALLWLWRKLA
ncbi:hypothetical protein PS004_23705, partial [Shigella sonnei]|nr:hypothetical protein [Shigella sonnei]